MSQQNVNNPTNNAQQSTSQSQTQHNPQEYNNLLIILNFM